MPSASIAHRPVSGGKTRHRTKTNMPIKVCSVCSAPKEMREALETRRRAGGKSGEYRVLARESGFSATALHRHMTRHMTRSVLEKSKLFQQGDSVHVIYSDELNDETLKEVNALPRSCWLVIVGFDAPISEDKINSHQKILLGQIEKKIAAKDAIEEEEIPASSAPAE
jgi:hypothetical protein